MRRSMLLTLLPVLTAAAMVSPSAAGAAGTVMFDSVPAPLPGSVSSLGFHLGENNEFGQILYPVDPGTLGSITVTMVSVACQEGRSVTHPLVPATDVAPGMAAVLDAYIKTLPRVPVLAASSARR